MAPRRERDFPTRDPAQIVRSNRGLIILVLAIAALWFAIARGWSGPLWSFWGGAETTPALTPAEIEALQAPVSENSLSEDWNLPAERLRRLARPSQTPEGIDAEVDRRWRTVILGLSPDRKFELLQALLVATGERPTPASDAEPAVRLSPETLAELRAAWEEEHAALFETLADAPAGGGKEKGAELVRSLRERVSRQLDALAAVGQPSSGESESSEGAAAGADDSTKQTLSPVLRAWDNAALAAVKDATANGDPGDFLLWYRLFQRLSNVPEQTLRDAAQERVTEASLTRQPDAHRGELFSLVGKARGGKSVKAQPNVLGIERYYVLWVQPEDDRDVVIAVYSLSKPEGFPDLPEDGEFVRFRVPVKAPVYFLKKLAYETESGISVSPQVLARSFRFEPTAPALSAKPPSASSFAISVAAALAIGMLVVLIIIRRTRRNRNAPEEEPARIDEPALRKRESE